ncbi:hypothetical protein NDU88_004760 [Pleurodeles waltl]|uniref:Uncharacterized protein n=1 Tax=Pleurodeles waltl TaxID=8319 RepID=A0AAV7W9G3_PLEWA|nr:hypothetical protein NDU88_004760 [Pleurodeles waltl]
MATSTGRFRVATPRSGQSMVIPGCLGHREFHHWHLGAPGQQSLTLRLCVPQGVHKRQVPHRAASVGPLSPRPFSVCSPAVGRRQAPPPGWEADSSSAGAHTRRSGLPPSLQGGPVTGYGAGRCAPPGSGPRRRGGARVRWGLPLGQRPRASGPARDSRSPTLLLRLGEPPGSARSGPPIDRAAAPSSSSRPCARSGGETATPLSPPVHSGRVTLL